MKTVFRRTVSSLLTLVTLLCLICIPAVQAQESGETTPAEQSVAKEVSSRRLVTDSTGFSGINFLFNGNDFDEVATEGPAQLTLEHPEGFGSLYILFGGKSHCGPYTVTDPATGTSHTCGENGFLHEFIDLTGLFGYAPTAVTLAWSGSVTMSELYAFEEGPTPSFVQKWQLPNEGCTDLVLFSTHADDEQLFFAGILPYYAGELKYRVQVVYLTDHRNRRGWSPPDERVLPGQRQHEGLNGLWAVGVTTYPVYGEYNDFLQPTMQGCYESFAKLGWSREEMLGFVVEQLRRFKPLVAIGHDFNGEYGHGQHMVYADLLAEAITVSNDPAKYPELAQKYGVWDVPKTYIHLYEQNQIVMDWDQPLESFGGLTAFLVNRELGFPCHVSQQRAFWNQIYPYYKASKVQEYSPCNYGLYRTTVGPDVAKNDFFENLTHYALQEELAEQARIEEEKRLEQERLEEEKRRQEEAARLEAERLEQERLEQERLEQERKEAEEAARLEAERLEAERSQREAKRKKELTLSLCLLGGLVVTAICLLIVLLRKKAGSNKKKV